MVGAKKDYRKLSAVAASTVTTANMGSSISWRQRLLGIPSMLKGVLFSGDQAGIGQGKVMLALLGLLYVVSPLDVIPEMILGPFGLGDDAAILALSIGVLMVASERWLEKHSVGVSEEKDEIWEGTIVS